jgi:hypothetical protein
MPRQNLLPTETAAAPEAAYAELVAQDEAFKEAVLQAHPDMCVGVSTELGTDRPRPLMPAYEMRQRSDAVIPRSHR